MSARDRRYTFERAVARGRQAYDNGTPYTANPYKPVGIAEQQHRGTHTTGAGIGNGAWAYGWRERQAEVEKEKE